MTDIIDPQELSKILRAELREEVSHLERPLKIAGLYVEGAPKPTLTYVKYAEKACQEVGVFFQPRMLTLAKFESSVKAMNADASIDGIFIFYPVFALQENMRRDKDLQSLVHPQKDIEGMSTYWLSKLYTNDRFVDQQKQKKAILPCTPLAILKLISTTSFFQDADSLPLEGIEVSIFNRSEVVGRPLAHMLANDGAKVYSFDFDSCQQITASSSELVGISRTEALARSQIIITGVPDSRFEKIAKHEIRADSLCLNFASIKNFSDDVVGHCAVYVPRVGPMTVTMVIRNALRLRINR